MPKIIENLKEKLLDEGKKVLIEKSYAQFNMRDVAKSCGIGLGTTYNYFKSKEDFVYEIFKSDWDKTMELTKRLVDSEETLYLKLKMLYDAFKNFIDSYFDIFMYIMKAQGPGNLDHVQKRREISVMMEKLISCERAKGNIKSNLSDEKLVMFIVSNMFFCIRNKSMTFEELYSCMAL